MSETLAIAMDKKINPESNSEKFEDKEIKKEETDSKLESSNLETKITKDDSSKSISKPKSKIESKDYFLDSLKESNQLGYKSRLDLIIRAEINNLEREVAKALGSSVEEIRNQFLNIKKQNPNRTEHLSFIPIIFIVSDYRTFLINAISIFRMKKINRLRY